ncbi:hypothetical protein BW13_08575 [Bifidobacterium sp. UTCIF-37]|nr:hypothetical protein BW13_08575 [Bifidobacterium sp. UTCIF-37]
MLLIFIALALLPSLSPAFPRSCSPFLLFLDLALLSPSLALARFSLLLPSFPPFLALALLFSFPRSCLLSLALALASTLTLLGL